MGDHAHGLPVFSFRRVNSTKVGYPFSCQVEYKSGSLQPGTSGGREKAWPKHLSIKNSDNHLMLSCSGLASLPWPMCLVSTSLDLHFNGTLSNNLVSFLQNQGGAADQLCEWENTPGDTTISYNISVNPSGVRRLPTSSFWAAWCLQSQSLFRFLWLLLASLQEACWFPECSNLCKLPVAYDSSF